MDNEILGKKLKKLAKAKGNCVEVDIQNVFNTLDALSHFFYRKKHEWIAICFFTEQFRCRLIWFNKGVDRYLAQIGISHQEVIDKAKSLDIK